MLLTAIALLVSTESAMAQGATLPALSLGGLRGWISSLWAGDPHWGNLPKQMSGTAAGKRHDASADSTRAHSGVGRAPGKSPGELAAYEPHAAKVAAGPSATQTGFDAKASKLRADKSTETSDYFENPDG